MNTGHDEILEIVKEKGVSDSRYYPSRILIKFKDSEIKSVLADKVGLEKFNDGISKVNLQLSSTEHKNLASVVNLELYAVSQSWDEGTGRYSNIPTSSNGTTWKYMDNDFEKSLWETFTFSSGTTGSITSSNDLIDFGGGTWYTGSQYYKTQQFNNADNLDTNFDVTSIIQQYSASIFNGQTPTNPLFSTASFQIINNVNATALLSLTDADGNLATFIFTEQQGDTTGQQDSNGSFIVNVSLDTATNPYAGRPGVALSQSINLSILNMDVSAEQVITDEHPGGFYLVTLTQQTAGPSGETLIKSKPPFAGAYNVNKSHTDSFSSGIEYVYEGIDNNGFLIKTPNVLEENVSSSFGALKYFSVDTHTIYPPKLCFKWDDSSYPDTYTGSAKMSGDLNVSLYRNQKEYNQNDVATIRVHVIYKYPNRAFTTTSNYLTTGYLTTSSYYSVRDADTEEEVIPFDDNFTKMSADSDGMYFQIYMNGLQPERYYRLLFKHINNDGTVIYDNDYHFKVIR